MDSNRTALLVPGVTVIFLETPSSGLETDIDLLQIEYFSHYAAALSRRSSPWAIYVSLQAALADWPRLRKTCILGNETIATY